MGDSSVTGRTGLDFRRGGGNGRLERVARVKQRKRKASDGSEHEEGSFVGAKDSPLPR
jgi:hypothetical protein